jgi:PfaD family protein
VQTGTAFIFNAKVQKMERMSELEVSNHNSTGINWQGELSNFASDAESMYDQLSDFSQPLWVVVEGSRIGLATDGELVSASGEHSGAYKFLGKIPALPSEQLGDHRFRTMYGTRYSYYSGAMANGIASEKLVVTLGKAGFLGSFGAAGLGPERIQSAINEIKAALGQEPYAFNLINSPSDPAAEARAADLYVKNNVRTVEASAFVDITVPLVYYRVSGLIKRPDGTIETRNKIIAKLSRREVAKLFLQSAPDDILYRLQSEGKITEEQAGLSKYVPMADDITVEADSGGHTDNRPLICLIPGIVALRDEIQQKNQYPEIVRVGAGGGIGTPEAAFAAFMMGAAYVVTGSVNQSALEAGTSEHTRSLLAQAGMADVAMAPASDMFEMGVQVQVLKRGTLFPMRAKKLWDYYENYQTWEDIPMADRQKLEKTVFKRDFDSIWEGTEAFFQERDPRQVERAKKDPHHKMALVFRWYLGLSSRWSNGGEKGREMDYQIWCGPSMGAFNDWVKGSYLELPENRSVVEIAANIMNGAAFLSRLRIAELYGVQLPPNYKTYTPKNVLKKS